MEIEKSIRRGEGGGRGLARLILQDSEAVVESLKFSSPCGAMASNRTLKKDSTRSLEMELELLYDARKKFYNKMYI